jgi:phosphodiesterase/alkaline phosphatase D-like protein
LAKATTLAASAPAPDRAATLEFAITSCQRWGMGRYAVLRHAAAENLDLMMFLGDGAKAVRPTFCALPGAHLSTGVQN